MNSDLQREILLMAEIDGNIKGSEAIKILSICSHLLNNEQYVETLKNTLDNVLNTPDFDFKMEICHAVLAIIRVNKRTNYYKQISIDRMKFVLYAGLYGYLIKNQTDLLNEMSSMAELRLLYANVWSALQTDPRILEIAKESWGSCMSRLTGFCKNDEIYIKP